MDKIVMNVKEMAKHLGVSAYTAYQLTKRPGFPTLKIGKRIAIPVEQFMDWMRGTQGMIERRENFKGDGKHLTEERNLGEAEIIVGDRCVQKR